MKKSIISLILLLTLALGTFAATTTADLQPNAPDRYTVVPGDTLWGIATRFLRDPWRWPELWRMNQSQLRNPHRIYPGDVLVLDRSGSRVTMRLDSSRVGPRARIEPRDGDAIHAIPPSAIEPFLSKPLVVSEQELRAAPEIVATQEDRVILGAGNVAYVRGLKGGPGTRWQIFRRGDRLVDPDTKELLGYIALYLGEAEMVRPGGGGEVSTVELTKAVQEVYRGDRLLPLPPDKPMFGYVPHAPQNKVSGRIISTYGGLYETGPLSIVTLSRGTRDGLEVGHVLALYRDLKSARFYERTAPLFGRSGPTGNDNRIPYVPPEVASRDSPLFATEPPIKPDDFRLPTERYGLIMVFRVFERASYALVMQASRPVAITDIVANP
jgi:hypothetical protein